MSRASSVEELRGLHQTVHQKIEFFKTRLKQREVAWSDLLLRKTASRELAQYQVQNATYLAMKQLDGLSLRVQAGEKVRYIVLSSGHLDKAKRVLSEETAFARAQNSIRYDVDFYLKMLCDVFREIWEYFAPAGYFDPEDDQPRLF